jgi:hypothetical protein
MGRENTRMFHYISRNRALWYILSHYLFGKLVILNNVPQNKAIRGLGINDSNYSKYLSMAFDYKNYKIFNKRSFSTMTETETNTMIDLYNVNFYIHNNYNFITCTEIMSHLSPYPGLNIVFKNLHTMLRPGGVLILSTPYSFDGRYIERHPSLYKYEIVSKAENTGTLKTDEPQWCIKNIRADGANEIINSPIIYNRDDPSSIEMRKLNYAELNHLLVEAGFKDIIFKRIDADMNYNGIHWDMGNDDNNSLIIIGIKNV